MRRYAEDTAVPLSRSRQEIDQLLREWGANGVQWTDDWVAGAVTLRFVWAFALDGRPVPLQARFVLKLRTDEQLKKLSLNAYGRLSLPKFEKLKSGRGRQEHRVLLLWLKAALNAVELGLVSPEALFLPFLEGADGRTVSEIATPALERLTAGSASLLLGSGA